MQIQKEENFIFLRLDHDDDVMEALAEASAGEKGTLFIAAGLGMMHQFEIGYFDNGEYLRKKIDEPVELLTLSGSIASTGEYRTHVHADLAFRDHRSIGGHLFSGKAWMSEEILLVRLKNISSERIIDPEKKVGVMQLISAGKRGG